VSMNDSSRELWGYNLSPSVGSCRSFLVELHQTEVYVNMQINSNHMQLTIYGVGVCEGAWMAEMKIPILKSTHGMNVKIQGVQTSCIFCNSFPVFGPCSGTTGVFLSPPPVPQHVPLQTQTASKSSVTHKQRLCLVGRHMRRCNIMGKWPFHTSD